MKKHAIIPIFIPHKGCPNDCVFCNQKIITARTADVTTKDVENIIESYLPTLENRGIDEIEVAFFGGSFTGIPIEEQSAFLAVAADFKRQGKIQKIHLSTRPDYISREILDNLKKYTVDIIELGVQSFIPKVLALSKRGHSAEDVFVACDLIKEYGFTLGIQLMIGLPGDTHEGAIQSAEIAASLKPSVARLYPTVVLENTELASMLESGSYKSLTRQQAITTTAAMYKILHSAGIQILRVGLKSTDLVTTASDKGGEYHPAFRQLVEGEIALQEIIGQIESAVLAYGSCEFELSANSRCLSPLVGHNASNKKLLQARFPSSFFSFKANDELKDMQFCVKIVR